MIFLHNIAKYSVCLKTGDIRAIINYSEPSVGPTKIVDSLILADAYSLNVLRQNLAEFEYREEPYEMIRRYVFGEAIEEHRQDILDKMKYLREQYPEEFI